VMFLIFSLIEKRVSINFNIQWYFSENIMSSTSKEINSNSHKDQR